MFKNLFLYFSGYFGQTIPGTLTVNTVNAVVTSVNAVTPVNQVLLMNGHKSPTPVNNVHSPTLVQNVHSPTVINSVPSPKPVNSVSSQNSPNHTSASPSNWVPPPPGKYEPHYEIMCLIVLNNQGPVVRTIVSLIS